MLARTHVALVLVTFALTACGGSTPPPTAPEGASGAATDAPASGKTTAHGSGGGTGAHGHPRAAAGNKDGVPGGTTQKHGSGEGGGRNSGGKTGEAAGNKDGVPGGTTAEHGSGHGLGRGGGKRAHAGDKNGKPGSQS
ncbi:MAG: hypothetical protein KIT84_32325 [Labilithrix sp.]|nr:hypothetical protein [Labilithrix sp.]MCW5815760.1 hypothetical protein [Labilithrix sp.]